MRPQNDVQTSGSRLMFALAWFHQWDGCADCACSPLMYQSWGRKSLVREDWLVCLWSSRKILKLSLVYAHHGHNNKSPRLVSFWRYLSCHLVFCRLGRKGSVPNLKSSFAFNAGRFLTKRIWCSARHVENFLVGVCNKFILTAHDRCSTFTTKACLSIVSGNLALSRMMRLFVVYRNFVPSAKLAIA